MDYLDRVQAGIDYIEANLDKNITLVDVSASANMSHWHFQRIFKALTNETLKSYVRSRRIANSMDSLFNKEYSILDVAIASGFESHESYTRAFQKLFGITPSEYRQNAKDRLIIRKTKFDHNYLDNLKNNLSLEPRFYSTEERFFVGLKTEVIGIESEKNNIADKLPELWNRFIPRLEEISNPAGETCYGIISHEKDDNGANKLFYLACTEVGASDANDSEMIPDGMVFSSLPKQHYAEFQHKGMIDVENINHTINYIYSSWLLNSNMRHTYQPDIEIYGPEFKMQSEDSIIYYAIPVETANQ